MDVMTLVTAIVQGRKHKQAPVKWKSLVCTCINGCQGNDLPNAYCLGIVFHMHLYIFIAMFLNIVQSNLHSIYV